MDTSMEVKIHYLLLVILIVGLLSACGSQTPAATLPEDRSSSPSETVSPPPDEPLGPPDRVDVVYFSRGKPCRCIAVVGERIYATVWINFQDELSNKLTFEMVNLDDTESAFIAKKYNATPFSLFINVVRGDDEHIVAVPEIWSTPGDAIEELVKSKIEQSLKGEE